MLKRLLILILCLPALALAAIQPLDRVAVVVNDDIIMQSQVQEKINATVKQLKQQNAELPPKDLLVKQVLEGMILESIQLQIAERGGIRVDDTSLNDAIKRIAAQNNMTLEQFQQAVTRDGTSYAQMREQIRTEMITTRARQGSVGPRIHITDQEIESFLASKEGEAIMQGQFHIAHILIKTPGNATQAETAKASKLASSLYQQLQSGSDFSALAKQYSAAANAPKGGDMGWRPASKLPSLFSDIVPRLNTGEVSKPIRSSNGFHLVKLIEKRGGSSILQPQTKVRHILIQPSEIRSEAQVKALINELHQRILAGEDFAELARVYSNDPGSRANGGDLGWMTGDALVPAFRGVMENIETNTLSQPFQSPYGWHILEVLGHRQYDIGEQTSERSAREILYKRKFNEELDLWLREIRDNAFVDIKL